MSDIRVQVVGAEVAGSVVRSSEFRVANYAAKGQVRVTFSALVLVQPNAAQQPRLHLTEFNGNNGAGIVETDLPSCATIEIGPNRVLSIEPRGHSLLVAYSVEYVPPHVAAG